MLVMLLQTFVKWQNKQMPLSVAKVNLFSHVTLVLKLLSTIDRDPVTDLSETIDKSDLSVLNCAVNGYDDGVFFVGEFRLL